MTMAESATSEGQNATSYGRIAKRVPPSTRRRPF